MLRAKFDGGFEDTPATYIWSRLVRMKSTREGASQKEEAGYLVGGYSTLIEAMRASIAAAGGKVHLRHPVAEIAIQEGRAVGLRVNGELHAFDAVAASVQAPIFRQMIPNADPGYLDFLAKTDYLGIITALLVLDRPLSGYWTLYITDETIPFTGVIETTTYIDPADVGGHHLVYLPKYTAPGSAWQQKSDAEIRETWLHNLERMFPGFERRWMRHFLIQRERFVEPLHRLNRTEDIPSVETPVKGLYLATTAQIYPALTNGESVSRHARQAAGTILARQAAHA
jgi:protoporphyrinogen oxidase